MAGACLGGGLAAGSLALRMALAAAGMAFALVAAAYLGGGPGLFMKRADGGLHPMSWLLLWPYHLLGGLSFQLVCRLTPAAPWTEVVPGLLLGRRLSAREAEGLAAEAVVDLACEMPENLVLRRRRYLSLPVLDTACPSPDQLRQGAHWMADMLARGPVYVHCALGHGRSATLVVAYLLLAGRVASVAEGVDLLKARRPGVALHPCQRQALEEFARGLPQPVAGEAVTG